MADFGLNADGTPAGNVLTVTVPVITTRGPANIQVRMTEGDARVLATTPPQAMVWMGPVVWEAILNNIVSAVGSKDHEEGP